MEVGRLGKAYVDLRVKLVHDTTITSTCGKNLACVSKNLHKRNKIFGMQMPISMHFGLQMCKYQSGIKLDVSLVEWLPT